MLAVGCCINTLAVDASFRTVPALLRRDERSWLASVARM
jgi:hypothetical protein